MDVESPESGASPMSEDSPYVIIAKGIYRDQKKQRLVFFREGHLHKTKIMLFLATQETWIGIKQI